MVKRLLEKITPHYQPIVRLSDNSVLMHECLARFIDIEGHGVGPAHLHHLFNDQGFTWELFNRTLRHIIGHKENLSAISINVDPKILDKRFFSTLETLATEKPDFAEKISFELAERKMFLCPSPIDETIGKIKELGHKVILDDFSARVFNKDRLKNIKFDMVKIDGNILTASIKSMQGLDKLKDMAYVLQNNGSKIIGGHIENESIADQAREVGIEYGQGYLYGRPSPLMANPNLSLKAENAFDEYWVHDVSGSAVI